jgi:hypothetical protein
MNLTGLIEATRTRLGTPSSDAFFTDQVVTDLVNGALQYISSQHDFPWLEASESLNTVANTETVATAATSQRTIALYDASGIQLEYKPFHDLVRIPKDAVSNTIRFFGMRGSTLVLRPCPLGSVTGALTHIYRAAEPRLTTGSDTPLMPQQFHDAIADKAANLGMMRQGDLNGAKLYGDLCAEWITAMIGNADRFADSTGGGARTETPEAK